MIGLSLSELKEKLEKLEAGCGFKNLHKEICGQTVRSPFKRRGNQSSDLYFCSGCQHKIGAVKKSIRFKELIEENEKLKMELKRYKDE